MTRYSHLATGPDYLRYIESLRPVYLTRTRKRHNIAGKGNMPEGIVYKES